MRDASVIRVNLSAITHNLRVVRRVVGPSCLICPIVKADAYGLGAEKVCQTLAGAGANLLAVYSSAQAAKILAIISHLPVLVMMPLRDREDLLDLERGLIGGRVHLTIHDPAHLGDVIRLAEQMRLTIPVHLKIDTGLSRGGCSINEAGEILNSIRHNPAVRLAGVFTHFARAGTDPVFTDEQFQRFTQLTGQFASFIPADCLLHAAASAATFRDVKTHLSMVRIGLAWIGYGPERWTSGPFLPAAAELQPAVSWDSRIIHIRSINSGTSVGYGSIWTASRSSTIAVVPVGYTDGYPRKLSGRSGDSHAGQVGIVINDQVGSVRHFAPVIGAVNMDQITIDLTEVIRQAGSDSIKVGTTVQLLSTDRKAPNYLPTLAASADTIPHDLLCGLDGRLVRDYLRDESLTHAEITTAIAG